MRHDYELYFAELGRRNAYLTALPGERLREDLEAVKRCLYIFGRNQVELSAHIARFTESETQLDEVTNDYLDEFVRLFHNFVSSVYTYVESQRVAMRHRWTQDGKRSAFETDEFAARRREVFETGEAEFMIRLRNYCTHYNIPVPGLATTFSQSTSGGFQMANRLHLDRDALLRWDDWGEPATAFLRSQKQQFDLVPIIDSYINATQHLFASNSTRIVELSTDLIAERNAKATEVRLWVEEVQPPSDWITSDSGAVSRAMSLRRHSAKARVARYEHGTHGFRLITVDPSGTADVGHTDWWPLPP